MMNTTTRMITIRGEDVFALERGGMIARWPVAPIMHYGGVTYQPNQPRATFPTRELADLAAKRPERFVWTP